MSTGAPLNLPKPKATTNTGQDMIELGNSLQKINDRFGRVDVWNKINLLWNKGGSWGSMLAIFDRNTKVLHLGFQITGVPSGIVQGDGVPILEIPFPIYGGFNQYSTSTGFSTGQLFLSGTTGVLTLFPHSANPTIIRCGMTIVLSDNAVP